MKILKAFHSCRTELPRKLNLNMLYICNVSISRCLKFMCATTDPVNAAPYILTLLYTLHYAQCNILDINL
jgi:hypothetical protein